MYVLVDRNYPRVWNPAKKKNATIAKMISSRIRHGIAAWFGIADAFEAVEDFFFIFGAAMFYESAFRRRIFGRKKCYLRQLPRFTVAEEQEPTF